MAQDFLADRSILVTGGTGSFDRRFAEVVLSRPKPRKLTILSRDVVVHAAALKQVPAAEYDHAYVSLGDTNDRWLSVEELRALAGEAGPVTAPSRAASANGHAAAL